MKMNICFYNACIQAEDVPAEVHLTDSELEIVDVNADGLILSREQLIAATSKAEVEKIEADLFDQAVEDGLVETIDDREEQRQEFTAGTGYPFGMHC